MAKIDRYDGNLQAFASSASGDERTIFGDTTQSDDLDDNINSDFFRGWGIVGVNENPTKQDFNAFAFTATQLIAYLHQMGIAEWNTDQEYHSESRTIGNDGAIYRSLTDSNTGNDPTTDDGTNWLPEVDNSITVATITPSADSDVTLDRDEYTADVLSLQDGSWTTGHNVIVPAETREYAIDNSAGTYDATVATSGGSGVTVSSGQKAILYCDGADVVFSVDTVTGTAADEVPTNADARRVEIIDLDTLTSDYTLSDSEATAWQLRLTGTPGADIAVIVPDTERQYDFVSELGGSNTVTVKTSGGTGVTVAGGRQVLRSDGTDVVSDYDVTLSNLRGYIDGLELSNNSSDSDHDIDIATGVAALRDGSSNYRLFHLSSALTKQFDAEFAEGDAAGGMASGESLAVDGALIVHLIGKPDGTVDVFGNDYDTSGLSPSLPSGFTWSRVIGGIPTDGSANLVNFWQDGDQFWTQPRGLISATNPAAAATLESADLSGLVSPEAVEIQGLLGIEHDTEDHWVGVAGDADGIGLQLIEAASTVNINMNDADGYLGGSLDSGGPFAIPHPETETLYWQASKTTTRTTIDINGWRSARGRNS